MLEDIAVVTGGQVVSEEVGIKFEHVTLEIRCDLVSYPAGRGCALPRGSAPVLPGAPGKSPRGADHA
jgi:hypothetical protein